MSQGNSTDDTERTNTIGLFNTARSYWQSAEHLSASKLQVSHPQAPVTFLFCHAIELYLKAFLRGKECTLAELKKWGHNVATLADATRQRDLSLGEVAYETLSHIADRDVAIEARYIVTGFKTQPTEEALASVSEELDHVVCKSLQEIGLNVREQHFEKPLSPDTQSELDEIEEYIPHMTQQDREIIAYLLHHNQRMFECAWDGGRARLLIARGIVRSAQRPEQMVDSENVPMEIPKPVWNLMLKHKAKFPYKPSRDGGHPWRVHWMAR